jgi:uncharacterized membrane protein (DUF2068 family)
MASASQLPPGTQRPRRYRPRFHYELIVCGLRGHELVGTDAAELRPQDAPVIRAAGEGVRWVRCLRCDSWLPLPAPEQPARPFPPTRDEIELPLRGRALRDKIVLRVIAIDRAVHFLVLALLAVAIFLFARHETQLRDAFYRALGNVGGGETSTRATRRVGLVGELDRLFRQSPSTLRGIGLAVTAYAVLEGVEAVGLWFQKRWAEYLTFIATTVFVPLEVYELVARQSFFRIVTLVINLAVCAYLLFAKRLFGLRGGARVEEEERERDTGWDALEETAPAAIGGRRPPVRSSRALPG